MTPREPLHILVGRGTMWFAFGMGFQAIFGDRFGFWSGFGYGMLFLMMWSAARKRDLLEAIDRGECPRCMGTGKSILGQRAPWFCRMANAPTQCATCLGNRVLVVRGTKPPVPLPWRF